MPSVVDSTVALLRAAPRYEIQLPKSDAKEQSRQHYGYRTVRFEGSQVTDPSASNTQAQEQKRSDATGGRSDSRQDTTDKGRFGIQYRSQANLPIFTVKSVP
jgi:hypothetical protein